MKAKEYLMQAYKLDKQIQSNIDEVELLKEMASSISSPSWEENTSSQINGGQAKFVKTLQKIEELQMKISEELVALMNLKTEIRETINALSNVDERMVLKYRYIHNYTWEQIAEEMNADRATVIRWHNNGISNITLPSEPTEI